jgi:hypothetical protein
LTDTDILEECANSSSENKEGKWGRCVTIDGYTRPSSGQKCDLYICDIYKVFIAQAYQTSKTSVVSPGKLKVIHLVITWSVSQSALRHRVLQKLLFCSVLCLYGSCE